MVYNLLLPGKRTVQWARIAFQILGRRWQIAMFAFGDPLFFPIAFSASPVRDGDKNDPAVDARLLLRSEEEDGEGKREKG